MTGRTLGLGRGVLSKILNEQRGFGSGFILRVMRGLQIKPHPLVDTDPEGMYMVPGVPGQNGWPGRGKKGDD